MKRKRGRPIGTDTQKAMVQRTNELIEAVKPMDEKSMNELRRSCTQELENGHGSTRHRAMMSLIKVCDQLASENKQLRMKLLMLKT